MKNTLIFTPSTSIFRGSMARTLKAGFFYVSDKGVSEPIKRRPALHTERLRSVFARESGLVDSGIWRAAFLSAYVNKSHHAQRNPHTIRGGNPPFRTSFETCQRGQSLAAGDTPAGKSLAQRSAFAARNSYCKITLKHLFSVT